LELFHPKLKVAEMKWSQFYSIKLEDKDLLLKASEDVWYCIFQAFGFRASRKGKS
jgi:hypothetical protein